MAKSKKREFGDLGEDIACRYLENKGYVVLGRNYWKPWGEIDIIAERQGILSFFEVKSVSRESGQGVSVRPEENMHIAKLERLHRVIQSYLAEHTVPQERSWQIDLACVFIDVPGRRAKVELLENIVL